MTASDGVLHLEHATATDVRRWLAARLGISPNGVDLTQRVVDNYNRHHTDRPYRGAIKPDAYRRAYAAA